MPDIRKYRGALNDSLKESRKLNRLAIRQATRLLEAHRKRIYELIAVSDFDRFIIPQLEASIRVLTNQYARENAGVMLDFLDRGWIAGVEGVSGAMAALDISAPAVTVSLLETAQAAMGDRIQAISEMARDKVMMEVRLGALGKPQTDVLKAIGRNLKTSLTFRSVRARAEAIAATEIAGIYAMASREAREQTQEVNENVVAQWLHAPPGSVLEPRESHLVLDLTWVGPGESFDVGGTLAAGPHDPGLPPGERINCACVDIPNVVDDSGRVIELGSVTPDRSIQMRIAA